jgi:hypothetical protein
MLRAIRTTSIKRNRLPHACCQRHAIAPHGARHIEEEHDLGCTRRIVRGVVRYLRDATAGDAPPRRAHHVNEKKDAITRMRLTNTNARGLQRNIYHPQTTSIKMTSLAILI